MSSNISTLQAVSNLQALLDKNSQQISDDDYLKSCNLLLGLHKRASSSSDEQNTSNFDRFANEDDLHDCILELDHHYKKLESIKIPKNITRNLKKLALKSFVKRTHPGMKVHSYDEEYLKKIGILEVNPDSIYKKYFEDEVTKAWIKRSEVHEEIQKLKNKRNNILEDIWEAREYPESENDEY